MYTICRIIIPFNILPGWEFIKLHWSKQHAMRNDLIKLLTVCNGHDEKYRCEPKTKRHVEIISHRKRLIRDNVNLRIGAKPLIDAMTNVGLLYDDSDKFLNEKYSQTRVYKTQEPFTEIIIKENND